MISTDKFDRLNFAMLECRTLDCFVFRQWRFVLWMQICLLLPQHWCFWLSNKWCLWLFKQWCYLFGSDAFYFSGSAACHFSSEPFRFSGSDAFHLGSSTFYFWAMMFANKGWYRHFCKTYKWTLKAFRRAYVFKIMWLCKHT